MWYKPVGDYASRNGFSTEMSGLWSSGDASTKAGRKKLSGNGRSEGMIQKGRKSFTKFCTSNQQIVDTEWEMQTDC